MFIYNMDPDQHFYPCHLIKGAESILLTMGAGGSTILFIVLGVYSVHKTNQTLITAVALMAIDVIGLILLLVIPPPRVKLLGFYLAWSYCAAYVLLVTSISNNVSGYTKKIFYNGMLMVFYTLGKWFTLIRDDFSFTHSVLKRQFLWSTYDGAEPTSSLSWWYDRLHLCHYNCSLLVDDCTLAYGCRQ